MLINFYYKDNFKKILIKNRKVIKQKKENPFLQTNELVYQNEQERLKTKKMVLKQNV
jgi:hypothetical protein